MNNRPAVVDKVPFQTDLKQLFENVKFYSAYRKLYLYHRNTGFRYENILDVTNNLLVKLYKASDKHSKLGEHIEKSEHNLVFEHTDLEILQRADALLPDPSIWNKNETGECNDDTIKESYNLDCALVKALEEVVGDWEEAPIRPAIRMVLYTLRKYENRRVIEDTIEDWNNHPDTTFEELKQVLKESIDAIEEQLNIVKVESK